MCKKYFLLAQPQSHSLANLGLKTKVRTNSPWISISLCSVMCFDGPINLLVLTLWHQRTPTPVQSSSGATIMGISKRAASTMATQWRRWVQVQRCYERSVPGRNWQGVCDCVCVCVQVNAVDHLGQTALHRVAHCGHLQTCRLLLSAGCDPRLTSLQGFSPSQLGSHSVQEVLQGDATTTAVPKHFSPLQLFNITPNTPVTQPKFVCICLDSLLHLKFTSPQCIRRYICASS